MTTNADQGTPRPGVAGSRTAQFLPERRARPQVVVIGGGFGGLAAAHGLRDTDVDVTLINRNAYNIFQPSLYQVATATLNAGDITWFLRFIRAHQHNVWFRKGTVLSIDHALRTIALDSEQKIRYDYLIIAAGVTVNFFDIPGAAADSMPLYTRSQALALRDKVFAKLEEALINEQDRDLRILVVGGGATGVGTAGALADLGNNDLPNTFPELNADSIHITLVEQSPFLLAPFHPHLREHARTSSEKRGVEPRLDASVKQVSPDGVILSDQSFVPADVVVWVGGAYVAAQLSSQLTAQKTTMFEYHDKRTAATIGRNPAVAQLKEFPRLTVFHRLGHVDRGSCVLASRLAQPPRHDAQPERHVPVIASQPQRDRQRNPGDHPGPPFHRRHWRAQRMKVQRGRERRQPIVQRDLMPCSAYVDGAICPRRFLVAGQTDSTDRRSHVLVPPELMTFDLARPGRLLPMVKRSERRKSVVCEQFGYLGIAGDIRQGR